MGFAATLKSIEVVLTSREPKARMSATVTSPTSALLSYRDSKQSFTVQVNVVEPPTGGQCLSLVKQSGEGQALELVLEEFDGLFV